MTVSIADIKKLRELTQAGMSDCKKALEESENFDAAVKWIREKFTKIAAKREAREAAQGVVIARAAGNYGAVVALKCETESVANNDRFQELAANIADLVMATSLHHRRLSSLFRSRVLIFSHSSPSVQALAVRRWRLFMLLLRARALSLTTTSTTCSLL